MSKIKDTFAETKANIKMSWNFIKNKKKVLIIILILYIILSLVGVLIPVLSAKLLLSLTNNKLHDLLYVSLFIFIVEITRNSISYLQSRISSYYSTHTIKEIQLSIFKETLNIETKEMDKNTTGSFIDRINQDASGILSIFGRVSNIVIDFVSNIGIVVAILIISPPMFAYFMINSLVICYINKKRRDIYYNNHKKIRQLHENRTSLISEIIRGIRDVKLLNAKEGIIDNTKKQLNYITDKQIKNEKASNLFRLVSDSIRDLFDVLFILLTIVLIYKNHITIANALIIYTYKPRVEFLLNYYDMLADAIKNYNLCATRVNEILGNKFRKETSNGLILDSINDRIEFRNVSFKYEDDYVLQNINLTITKGERVGFVGESGSGKSTIFNLLTRLYETDDGDIFIDNHNLKDLNIDSLRKNISLIPQSPYIFNFTVKENLTLSNRKKTDEEIIEAVKKAHIYDRIMELDDKFETKLGEGGIVLSGGEKQRLAIARSLLKDSNILLFDEATSALDNITQDEVQKSIYGLNQEKTILIIAHRLSTVINCDRIVVLDKGRIVDIGSHEELLKRCKKYQSLFKYESKSKTKN